jgi:hypothetical protein
MTTVCHVPLFTWKYLEVIGIDYVFLIRWYKTESFNQLKHCAGLPAKLLYHATRHIDCWTGFGEGEVDI